MKKIKAREILLMNPKLNLIQLKGFRYFAIDRNGEAHVFNSKPTCFVYIWAFDKDFKEGAYEFIRRLEPLVGYNESLREIDFEEDQQETQEQLYHKMFLHMKREHDLHLTNKQMYEIVLLAKKIKTNN